MKLINLDGELIKLDLSNNNIINDTRSRSDLHLKAREILKSLFPTTFIIEEVMIKIEQNTKVYLDFYIPSVSLVVEVNGQQHYNFNPFFHQTKAAFMRQKILDAKKIEWCQLNNLYHIPLKYNESEEVWMKKIINR